MPHRHDQHAFFLNVSRFFLLNINRICSFQCSRLQQLSGDINEEVDNHNRMLDRMVRMLKLKFNLMFAFVNFFVMMYFVLLI